MGFLVAITTSAGPEASRADAGPDPNSVDSRTLEDAPRGLGWISHGIFLGEMGGHSAP